MPRPRPTTEKRCPTCKETLGADAFYQSEKYDGGLSPYCKVCSRARTNNLRGEDREKQLEQQRNYYYKHRETRRANANQRSAEQQKKDKANRPAHFRAKKFFDGKRSGVAPDVTRDYLEHLFLTVKECQCCRKPLTLEYQERDTREYRSNPSAPSVDRVNNDKGYTRQNIAIICWECNFRKTDLTLADLDRMTAYIKKFGDLSDEL